METEKDRVPSLRKSEIAGFAFEKSSPVLAVSVYDEYIAESLYFMITAGLVRTEKVISTYGNIHAEVIPEASDNVKNIINEMGTERTPYDRGLMPIFLYNSGKFTCSVTRRMPRSTFPLSRSLSRTDSFSSFFATL
jgi:hypothetical protein